jgi:hypothetical protein
VIDAGDRLFDFEMLDHVVIAEGERRIANVFDVLQRARVEVVHADDAVTSLEQVLAEM